MFFVCSKKTNQQRSGERKGTLSLVRLRRIPGVYTPLRGTPQSYRALKKLASLRQFLTLIRQLLRCSAASQWEKPLSSKAEMEKLF